MRTHWPQLVGSGFCCDLCLARHGVCTRLDCRGHTTRELASASFGHCFWASFAGHRGGFALGAAGEWAPSTGDWGGRLDWLWWHAADLISRVGREQLFVGIERTAFFRAVWDCGGLVRLVHLYVGIIG